MGPMTISCQAQNPKDFLDPGFASLLSATGRKCFSGWLHLCVCTLGPWTFYCLILLFKGVEMFSNIKSHKESND